MTATDITNYIKTLNNKSKFDSSHNVVLYSDGSGFVNEGEKDIITFRNLEELENIIHSQTDTKTELEVVLRNGREAIAAIFDEITEAINDIIGKTK